MWRIALVSLGATLMASAVFSQPIERAPLGPAPAFSRLAGELYRVDAGSRVTVVLATDEGLILADPLDRETARSLETELTARFPDRAVRYVLHTGFRFDRAEGSSAFTDTAEVVAHETFTGQLSWGRRNIPYAFRDLDRNANRVFETSELGNDERSRAVLAHDSNSDKRIRPGELYLYVADAESDYTSTRTITLGPGTVQLVAVPSHDQGSTTALLFLRERHVFVEHYPNPSQSFASTGLPLRTQMDWLRTIAALDFDTLLAGDGSTVTRNELRMLVSYLTALQAVAQSAFETGQPMAAQPGAAALDVFRGAPFYRERQTHFTEIFRSLRAARLSVRVVPAVKTSTENPAYCASYTDCGGDTLIPGATVAADLSVRRLAATAEVSLERQSLASRTSPLYDDAWAHRETTLAVLLGYAGPWAARWTQNLVGGVSFMWRDSDGVSRTKQVFFPGGGLRSRHQQSRRYGLTGGADFIVPFARRYGIVFPVRVTYAQGNSVDPLLPGKLSFRAGIGLRADVYRSSD